MKLSNILINTTLAIAFLFGVALVFNEPIQTYLIARASDNVMNDVPATKENFEKNQQAEASFDFDAVEELTLSDIFAMQNMASYVPVIAQIAVPSVDLHLPIAKGVEEIALATGAGTMKPDQQLGEGNYALASHNLEGTDVLFSPLHQAQLGDVIYLTDLQYVYTYEITISEVIPPTAVYVLDDIPNKRLLTLITCAFNGEERLHIQGTFVDKTPIDAATEEMTNAFELQQNHKRK